MLITKSHKPAKSARRISKARELQSKVPSRRRFIYRADPDATQAGVPAAKRSPFWQPVDPDC
jgi:hypothetical protein